MKKLLFLLLVFSTIFANAQNKIELKENSALIGYVTSSSDDFDKVMAYVEKQGNEIVDYCYEDGLILFNYCDKTKDVKAFARKIQDKFGGDCCYKEDKNSFYEGRCKERIIKENEN